MKLLKSLISHDLISGSFYIFVGSMFANLLAFLLNLFLARNLNYADYAIYATLLSVINLFSIPANSLNAIVSKFATVYFVSNQKDKLKQLYIVFFKFVLGVCLFLIIFFITLIPVIGKFLNIDNPVYLTVTVISICLFYLSNLNNALLQSLLKFGFLSVLTSFGGILKIATGVVLVYAGYRALGGILAVVIMTLGMYLISYVPLLTILKTKSSGKINLNIEEIRMFAIPTFVTIVCMTSFTSIDVILVKHFFRADLAGLYAGLSLIGKVIFYFTFPIPVVMFPLLIKRHTTGKGFLNLFYLSLIIVAIPSLLITAFYFIRPEFVINIFLGGRNYLLVSRYLGIFAIFLSVFSLVNVFVNLFLSLNYTKVFMPVVLAALLQILLINLFHADFNQVIWDSLIVSAILFVCLSILFITKQKELSAKLKNISDNPNLI